MGYVITAAIAFLLGYALGRESNKDDMEDWNEPY